MKAELIVALDVNNSREAVAVIDSLPAAITWYKVGLELFCAEGPSIIQAVKSHGKKVFLDLKLHDIPRTVERAVTAAAQHGVDLLTVHASGGHAMLKAAADAAHACAHPPRIIAVTALTSLDEKDLADLGIHREPKVHVVAMADLALKSGVQGLVCSPHEVEALRTRFGPQPLLVTPGIRAKGSETGDQKRTATAAAAVKAGSSFLVVGRPILQAVDPAAAARTILNEMNA